MTAPDSTIAADDSMVTAAVEYALRGWRVHPVYEWTAEGCACGSTACKSPGKHARLRGWPKKASADGNEILSMWSTAPGSSIGIATGHGSGLVIVDLDDDADKPATEHGTPSWQALVDAHGAGPKTYTVKTPRGWHLYYRLPDGAIVGNRARLRPGIDVRGDGGYVVAPPSMHHSGTRYRVARDAPVAPAPPWLLAMLERPRGEDAPSPAPLSTDDRHRRYALAALDSACIEVRAAPEGARNDTLNRQAFALGRLVGAGALSEGLAIAGLADAGQSAGLSAREAEDVARRGVADGACRPRVLPEPTNPRGTMRVLDGGGADEEEEDPRAPVEGQEAAALSPEDVRSMRAERWGAVRAQLRANPTTRKPVSSTLNVRIAIEADPRIGPHLWRDRVTGAVWWGGVELSDEHASALSLWIDACYRVKATSAAVQEAVLVIAAGNERDPLAEYLTGLVWDGIARLDSWLFFAGGAVEDELTALYARRFCIGAVRRALVPGCKLDTALVLVGPQGAMKSSVLAALVGHDHYSDTQISLDNKDALIHFRRPWVHEFAELESLSKSSVNRVKAVLSSQADEYRPPYGRTSRVFPRRCLFVGTTNEPTFLSDATGERRFWPVPTTDCDPEWAIIHRDQVWAEAVVAHRAGERHWFTREEDERLRAESVERFRAADPWQEQLARWLDDREPAGTLSDAPEFSMYDALTAIGLTTRDSDNGAARRVGHCLRGLGYDSRSTRRGGVALQLWSKATT